MEVFEYTHYLGAIHPFKIKLRLHGLLDGEAADSSEVCEQLSSVDQFQPQVQTTLVLRESVKINDERVRDQRQDLYLVHYVVGLLRLYNFNLLHYLQSDVGTLLLVLSYTHSTEGT